MHSAFFWTLAHFEIFLIFAIYSSTSRLYSIGHFTLYIHFKYYWDLNFRYEIMDGAPVKGESIPIRVFLAGYDLTPTMRDINKKFSVRYYLNLVLVDEEDRRYFKQQVN